MKRIMVLLIALFLGSISNADYFVEFTQLNIQPEFGRISITRGLAREPKYVDWMIEHREELASEKNIFVDASWNTKHAYLRMFEMDGQHFQIIIESNHFRHTGPGTACADNYVSVIIDGKKRVDIVIGNNRGLDCIDSIEIIPISSLISVKGNAYRHCDDDCSCFHNEAIDSFLFYDGSPDSCLTTSWFFGRDVTNPEEKPKPSNIVEASEKIEV